MIGFEHIHHKIQSTSFLSIPLRKIPRESNCVSVSITTYIYDYHDHIHVETKIVLNLKSCYYTINFLPSS